MVVTVKKTKNNVWREVMLRVLLAQACSGAFCFRYKYCTPSSVELVFDWYTSKWGFGIPAGFQMVLFGMYGVQEAMLLKQGDPNKIVKDHVLPAYLDWFETQSGSLQFRRQTPLTVCNQLHRVRSPDEECMNVLKSYYFSGMRPKSSYRGSGALARSTPFLFSQELLGLPQHYMLGVEVANLTHDHVDPLVAVYAYMRLCALLIEYGGQDLESIFQSFYRAFPTLQTGNDSVADICMKYDTALAIPALQAAIAAFKLGADTHDPILGYQALVGSCARSRGDAEVIASLAGALWGCYGYSVPNSFLVRLLERSIIESMVNDMF